MKQTSFRVQLFVELPLMKASLIESCCPPVSETKYSANQEEKREEEGRHMTSTGQRNYAEHPRTVCTALQKTSETFHSDVSIHRFYIFHITLFSVDLN